VSQTVKFLDLNRKPHVHVDERPKMLWFES
jgi:hypothetical protein